MPQFFALLYARNGHQYQTGQFDTRVAAYRWARANMQAGERVCIAMDRNGDGGTFYEKVGGLLVEAS